jgi:hypothetical protein
MRIRNIKSIPMLKAVIAKFGPFDSFSESGKNVELFKMENCDWCATLLKGANSVIVEGLSKSLREWLDIESPLLGAPDDLDEVECNEDGDCLCSTCLSDQEDRKLKEQMKREVEMEIEMEMEK